MASNSNALHLVWDNHLENVSSLFQVLYQDNKLVDVTLACQDGLLRAHKLILSACSPYFERIFHENPCKHPVVIMRGVHFQEMQLILEYIYKGYIDIPASFLNSLICIASELEIKGFENFRNFQGNYQSSSTLIGEQYNEPKSTKHREDGIEGHTSLNEPINNRPAIQEATERSASSNINLCRRETRLHGKRRIMVNNPYNFDCDSSFCNKKYQKSNSNSEETEPVHNILNSETLLIEASKVKEKPDRPPVPQFRIENVLIDNQWMDTDDSAAYEEKSTNDNDEKDYDFNVDNESTDDTRKTELICGVCFYKCRSKKDLLFHQKSHMKTGKPHKCEFCPSSFTRSSHLARHRRMHTGERPFNCLTCGKTFARQDKLKQHTRTSHVKTKTFLETTINEQETKEVIENNIEIPKPVPHYEQEDQNRPMLPIIKTEKRKRGRPRKYPIGAAPAPMPMIGPKRGRGRPRKIKIPVPEVSIPWENIKEECRSPVADHDNNFSLLELSTDEHIAIEPLIEIRTEPHQLNLREDDNHHSPMIDTIYQSDIDINITAGYSQKADDENLIKSETNLTILNENVTIENIIETKETPINQNENERTNDEVFQTNDNIVSNIILNSTDTDLIELSDKDVTTEDDPLKINEQSVETNEGLIATTQEIIKNNDIIADELVNNKDSTSVNTN